MKALILVLIGSLGLLGPATQVYRTDSGTVYFKSDAALELIEARSKNLRGALDLANNRFAFAVRVSTFQGI